MSLVASLQALSASGAFASRAFLPLLLVASIARWPQSVNWIPFVPDVPVMLSDKLAWLTSPWCIGALAVLALLEALAERDADARMVLQELDAPIKAVAAFVTAFALVDAETASLLRHVAGMEVLSAGLGFTDGRTLLAIGFAVLVGGMTFALATWRTAVFREARDIADDFGLGKPLAWLEETWSASCVLLAVLAPFVAILFALASLVLLKLVQVTLERAAERGRMPCGECGAAALPAARACPGCGAERTPRTSGAGGAWPDRLFVRGDDRDIELLARGRCPACAERREPADLLGHAPHPCGWPRKDGDHEWTRELLGRVRSRIGPLALFAALLGLLPVAGTVAALVTARARIGSPLRRYLPAGARFRVRWTIRLVAIPLLLGSGVPLLSSACAAALVAISGLAWTSAFEREIARGGVVEGALRART